MRVLVIGGGAAGMLAALRAADLGAEVTLLEQNEKLGKKLFITGKGRCNVTNACDREEFFAHLYSNPRFLYSAFGRFNNYDMMELLESLGVPLKTERGERVFPQSDKSSDVIRALETALSRQQVAVRLHRRVTRLLVSDGRVTGAEAAVTNGPKKTETYGADRVILATGGLGYPQTGSTGDGLRFAAKLGHSIVPCIPALVPLNAVFPDPVGMRFAPRDLMGLSLKNIAVRFTKGREVLCEDFGELLFTHFGVSGPVILSASGRIGRRLREGGEPVLLHIDLKPALSPEQMEERYRRETEGGGAREIGTYLGGWLPRALTEPVLLAAGLEPHRRLAGISAVDRRRLLAALKDLVLEIRSLRGYEEAIITQGGVSVREVDPATMASRLVRGLYFAGELLDLDAATGGFNLQIAWSTGCAAGTGCTREEKA